MLIAQQFSKSFLDAWIVSCKKKSMDKEQFEKNKAIKDEILKEKAEILWKAYALLQDISRVQDERMENAKIIWMSMER